MPLKIPKTLQLLILKASTGRNSYIGREAILDKIQLLKNIS